MGFGGEPRTKFHDPSVQSDVVKMDSTTGHDFFQITIGNWIPNLKKYGVEDRVFWELNAGEGDHGCAANVL